MDAIELRIALTEEMVRELLWHALEPDALTITGTLNNAIAEQQSLLGVMLDGLALAGISITMEAGTMYAELSYAPARRAAES